MKIFQVVVCAICFFCGLSQAADMQCDIQYADSKIVESAEDSSETERVYELKYISLQGEHETLIASEQDECIDYARVQLNEHYNGNQLFRVALIKKTYQDKKGEYTKESSDVYEVFSQRFYLHQNQDGKIVGSPSYDMPEACLLTVASGENYDKTVRPENPDIELLAVKLFHQTEVMEHHACQRFAKSYAQEINSPVQYEYYTKVRNNMYGVTTYYRFVRSKLLKKDGTFKGWYSKLNKHMLDMRGVAQP